MSNSATELLESIGLGSGESSNTALFQSGITDASNRLPEYKSPNDMCPICKTDRYSKPSLRLLISPCYHKLCERCVEHLFSVSAAKCPHEGCGRVLRKTNFIHQTFEDLVVERELGVRRRVAYIFNKTRDDFDSDREYNDYLEMVEDITFNLINDVDRAATERRITEYTNQNATQITSNASRAREQSARQHAADLSTKLERQANARRAREEEALGEAEREGLKARAWEDIAKGGTGEGAYERLKRLKAGSIPPVAPTKSLPLPIASLGKENTSPLSPSYAGPYVPYPFSRPSNLEISSEYHDPPTFEAQRRAHGSDTGRVKAGGWVVEELWERDYRLAAESLWVV